MSWTRAVHLDQWADTHDARAQLPNLVRRLVRSTTPSLKSATFPAGEESQRPGFDGEVEALKGDQFVPDGFSGWEMGADKSPQGKAEEDFQNRTAKVPPDQQKDIVFVFVTPRTWRGARDWAKAKAANSGWRGVVALDANDLEHWLEDARDVDVWFTRLTGRASPGVQDVESYWKAVQSVADFPLDPSVFTASREPESAVVNNWLSGPPSSLFMQSSGLSDGLDFVVALSLGPAQDKLQNALIVHNVDAWRDFATSRGGLVLIAAPALELQASDTAGAVNSGHHVFLSGPRGNIASGPGETLRRQDWYSISEALVTSGFSDSRAMNLARACCGSSSILKRLVTRHPETVFPPWCRDDVRASLAPFALVGGWVHVEPAPQPRDPDRPRIGAAPPIDVDFVTELVGCDRDQLDALVARWQDGSEPLFMRFGNSVLVSSREDAWHLLGGAITREQLTRFKELAILVLEEDNPAFQLPKDQRWLANLYGKTHSLSEDFRRSLVETLALMAVYPRADRSVADQQLKEIVQQVLETVLPANATWQRWASFGRNLMIAAEADPELFLRRIEADLASDEPALPQLFQEQPQSMFAGTVHTNLLWALEGLAWTGDYLSRVAVCLAKLASRDPGGSRANRPANSLHEIFLLWLWHTNASLPERISALSAVLAVEPVVGWKLLQELLPRGTSTFSYTTYMPRWRPWADGWSREKIRPQMAEYASAVANLTIQTAGTDPKRWAEVLEGMLRLGPEVAARAFTALEEICSTAASANSDALFALWNELRRIVSRHERYSHAEWAFDEAVRTRLAAIRDRLQPADAIRKYSWLFEQRVELAGFDLVKEHAAHDKALDEARLAGLREIIADNGADGLFRLLDLASETYTVGVLVGAHALLGWENVDLPAILDTSDRQRLGFIGGFIRGRFHNEGFAFADQLPIAKWAVSQIGTFGRCLPFGEAVWRWLERFGEEVVNDYWRKVGPIARFATVGQVQTAATMFIRVGRGFPAIEVVESALRDKLAPPADLIADALECALTPDSVEAGADSNVVDYSVQQLIKALQEDNSFDRSRLARLEWGFLPFLDPEFSEVVPDTLVRAIEADPQFFVDLVRSVYRGANGRPSDDVVTEQEEIRALNSHKLLSGLSRLPGTRDDGTLDYDHLRQWLTEVRLLAEKCDRRAVCDEVLGEFIARASRRSEDDWPQPELAKLMDDIASDDLFRGFVMGAMNSREVTISDPTAGGNRERKLIERYRKLEQSVRPFSPKVADAFHDVLRHYEIAAQEEDERSRRERPGR